MTRSFASFSLRRKTLMSACALAFTALASSAAFAAFPEKPIRVVIGFPAGGPLDQHARLLTERLQAQVTLPSPRVKVCRGRLFSARDYVLDVAEWGFGDVVGKGLEERHDPIH